MAYTKFAEFLRVLRVKNHENMGDTAKLFGVNIAFVSAVESGKKNVPEDWVDKIVQHYNLNEQEKAELIRAVEDSKTISKIKLTLANGQVLLEGDPRTDKMNYVKALGFKTSHDKNYEAYRGLVKHLSRRTSWTFVTDNFIY